MPDILKTENNVVVRHIDMLDGTWAKRQSTAIVGSSGTEANVNALGQLRVRAESTSLMSEEFDALDTTNRWTLKTSGGTATAAQGTLVVNGSTTASAWGGIQSQPTFQAIGLNFIEFGGVFMFPNTVIANTKRFFGMGTIPATPTVAVPITDGFGFELDGTGQLWAVIYESGVRSSRSVNITTAANITSGAPLPFIMGRRADTLLFYATNNFKPDATIPLPGLDLTALPLAFLAVNDSVAPASSPSLICFGVGVGDTGCNAGSIKDPVNPFWQAAVTKPSTAVASTQSALAVALHPSSPSPSPVAPDTSYFVNSAATTNGALIASGTSGLQALFASNIGAADAFVKLYNKATAPTVGTDVPELVLKVPAGGNIELKPGFSGYRFNLGLGIAITNLVADTDTTAVAAGQVKVKISRTV